MNRPSFAPRHDPLASGDADPDLHITQDDVVRFLKRGFLWAAAAAAAAGAAMFLYQRGEPPVYEAVTTVYAADNVVDLRSVGLSALVSPSLHVDAYEAAARSDEVLSAAIDLLDPEVRAGLSVDVLRRRIDVDTNQESRLISIQASAGSPEEAAARSEAVAQALVAWDAQRPRENLLKMIESLRLRIASMDAQISGLGPGPQRESLSTLRDEQVAQLATAVMLSDSVVGRLEIVQPPRVPSSPVAPSPVFDAVLAAMVAFALAYLARLLLAIFDGRLRDPDQVPLVSGLPLLAVFPPVPRLGTRALPAVATGFLRSALVPDVSRPTAVLLAPVDASSKASRLALALSESFARAGSSVLLVATAPRDPEVLERVAFRPTPENTLEAHLRLQGRQSSPFYVTVDGPGVLAVLPSWEPSQDSSELLTFGMRNALEAWRTEYDVVVVVTPPVLGAADAVTVAPLVDRTVLVVSKGVPRSDLATAAGLLRQREVVASGVVVTGVRSSGAADRVAARPQVGLAPGARAPGRRATAVK
ncbi:MAG TPA: hypothetical protein VF202_00955 [Trueperaceae bacterium]